MDLHSDFIEKSIVNYQKYKKVINNTDRISVDFKGINIYSYDLM